MPVDLKRLYAEADALYPDLRQRQAKINAALRQLAQAGDVLSYIMYVHGSKHEDVRSFCRSKHAFAMADLMERQPKTLIVSHPESGKTLIHRSELELWIGRQTELSFTDPNATVPSAAYVMGTFENQAEAQVSDIRTTIEENDRYRDLFPHVEPDKRKKWEAGKWFLKRPKGKNRPEATLTAFGCEGDMQGLRFGKVVVDDPISQKDAKSDTIVRDRVRWILATLERRVLQEGDARYVFTRWREQDMFKPLSGVYETLVMPAYGFWEQHPEWGYQADTLWPEKWPKRLVEIERNKLVDAGEAALWPLVWLCNPTQAEGDIFRREWLRFGRPPGYHEKELEKELVA